MFEEEKQNYYELLDIKPDASQSEIRQAYLRAKAAYSKDSAALYSLFDENETRHVLEMIEQAYLVLSAPDKRKDYDKVHGFFKSPLETVPTVSKPAAPAANVFSFESGTIAPSNDLAHQAANSIFGTNAPAMPAPGAPAPAAAASGVTVSGVLPGATTDVPGLTPPTAPQRPIETIQHEDYSTPRTLASLGAAGPPIQEYSSSPVFTGGESRLGIIRRVDLVKPYTPNPEVDSAIATETQFRGAFLKKVREYRGIAIDELADFTKISKTYISCIENEEFESLPAAAYLRGFVVQLAKALKLPHDKTAAGYMTHYRSVVTNK